MARKLERHDAKRLYCEELKEIPEISKMLNVPEKTVYRWKTEDKEEGTDWDKEREEIRMTSFSAAKSMLRAVVTRLDSMVKEIGETHKINPSEVYALRQLLKSVKEIQKDVDALGNVMLMMQEFTDFLAARDPDMLQKLHPYLVEFGNEMSKKYGRK
jgi:transposase